jgi:predicted amidohydrolase
MPRRPRCARANFHDTLEINGDITAAEEKTLALRGGRDADPRIATHLHRGLDARSRAGEQAKERRLARMKFKLALCQMKGSTEKAAAHAAARAHIREAAGNGARVVSLPEIWNCPYSNKYFRAFAEDDAGESVGLMAELAKENGVWLIGGSIPELDGDKVYNTCYAFSPQGDRIGKYRKIHLFDIDVKGSVRFMESETLSAGERRLLINTEFCKIGVAVCYDVRFPELFAAMAGGGARLIVLPGAFTVPTGAAHWELLTRARARQPDLLRRLLAGARPGRALPSLRALLHRNALGRLLRQNRRERIHRLRRYRPRLP